MKKAEFPHVCNIHDFIVWLFNRPEPLRVRILEEIYPGIKDPVSDLLVYYLLNDRLPSFAPAIIKYVAETKGITLSFGDRRVILAAETFKVAVCMAVGEEPEISADKMLFLIQRLVHDCTERFLNMPEEEIERIYDGTSTGKTLRSRIKKMLDFIKSTYCFRTS